jgi:hypothetical protein
VPITRPPASFTNINANHRFNSAYFWTEAMKLDKTQIARRQLGTSLALFLEGADPVSVHTLACAGSEIAEHLTRKAGAEPFSTHALATFPDLDIKDLRRIRNQYWNAFKHATTFGGVDRADEELLERFKDEINDHTLFVGWYDYTLATGVLPIEAQVFQIWYYARYPEKLNPNVDTASHQKLPKLAFVTTIRSEEGITGRNRDVSGRSGNHQRSTYRSSAAHSYSGSQ